MATRRHFLRTAAGIGTASLIPGLGWAAAGGPSFLAAAKRGEADYCLVGLTASGAETFRIPIPDRGHAAAANPVRAEAVAFARRPGTFAVVIDCIEGREVARLVSPEDRHFYGHGAFSADGRLLFTTENAISEGQGRLGIWDAADGYRRIGEVPTGGVGPHEVLRMPDGRRLAVANGGILTEPQSGRAQLNPTDLHPSLAYIDIATGEMLAQILPPEAMRLNSIRHIATAADGTLAAALQWEGAPLDFPPLLAVHRPGSDALEYHAAPPDLQRRTRNYAGSVAVSADGRLAAITAPRGSLMLVFDLSDGREVRMVEAADICGVAAAGGDFACTTGTGAFLAPGGSGAQAIAGLAFDNHLIRV